MTDAWYNGLRSVRRLLERQSALTDSMLQQEAAHVVDAMYTACMDLGDNEEEQEQEQEEQERLRNTLMDDLTAVDVRVQAAPASREELLRALGALGVTMITFVASHEHGNRASSSAPQEHGNRFADIQE